MRPEQHINTAEALVLKAENGGPVADVQTYVQLAIAHSEIARAKIALERLRSKP